MNVRLIAALTAAVGLVVLMDRSLTLPAARVSLVQATDVVVTACTPQGLVAAMNNLNGTTGGMINFDCNNVKAPATITITQAGGFNVTTNSSYTIDGGSVITLTGADANRIFRVFAGSTLTLTNIVLTNGYSAGDYGGAVRLDTSTSALILDHATLQNSHTNGLGGAPLSLLGAGSRC